MAPEQQTQTPLLDLHYHVALKVYEVWGPTLGQT